MNLRVRRVTGASDMMADLMMKSESLSSMSDQRVVGGVEVNSRYKENRQIQNRLALVYFALCVD